MMRRTGLVLGLLVTLVMMPTRLMAQSLDELTQQGNAAWSAKNYTESENIWKKAVLLYPNDSRSYFGLGFIFAEQKKLEEAIAAYRQAIKLNPDDADYYNGLGIALRQTGKLEDAIAAYRKAIELDPKDAKAYYNLGNVLDDLGKKEEAIAAYRKAIELDPKDAQAYYNLGVVLDDLGKKEEAIAAYRKAIELDPQYAAAYYNLGVVLDDLGKKEEAIAAYRKAIELDPKYAYAYNGLGNALNDLGKKEEAIAAYRKAIELDPKYTKAYFNLGVVLNDLGKKEEAIAAYRQAIKLIKPDDAYAYRNLGVLLDAQGKKEEAIAAYRKATQLKPDYANTYYILGFVLDFQGKKEEAIAAYQKALSLPENISGVLTTTHILAHNNLGRIYQGQDKLNEALQEFQAAVRIDPNFEFAQNNLKEVKRLWALKNGAKTIALNEIRWLDKEDTLTTTKRSVVKIIALFPGNGKGYASGTGYVIKREGNKTWILTNRHCVFDQDTKKLGETLQIELYYGSPPDTLVRNRTTATVVPQSGDEQQLDITLLEVTGLPEDIKPLPLVTDKVNGGMAINIIGHPDKDWVVESGKVIQLEGNTLKLQVKIQKGNSGGPVLNSEKQAIGIVHLKDRDNAGIAYPTSVVLTKLKQWGINLP